MIRTFVALAGSLFLGLSPLASAQTPGEVQDVAPPAEAAPPAEDESQADAANRVEVIGKPSRRMVYDLYQKLASNDFCPPGLETPRGYACAEVTYDVFGPGGKHLGKCNVPIFRLFRVRFEYIALTLDKFDCSDKKPNSRTIADVPLEELFNPRTKDGTTLKRISIMGIDQARDLCEISSEICVLKLFDHERELTFCSRQRLWAIKPPEICAGKK